ncbi:MAG: DUF1249 domain-containing protein [Candidatus Lokiarchaeota archaeon]|nr:DUF1249 domain-containing protein [Candidatus Lokiarchaeota archaeon]
MNKTIYERIFTKLTKFIDFNWLIAQGYLNYKSAGFMDLHVDFLRYNNGDDDSFIISIAHNYKHNGDIMCDPDMEVRIIKKYNMAEALTFQQDNLGVFQRVYDESNNFNPTLKKQLNQFLNQWLSHLLSQKYSISN